MWYILIFASIIFMVVCYVKARGMDNPHIRRLMARGKMTKADIMISNRAAAIFAASLVLLFIGASIVFSDPGGTAGYANTRKEALAWREVVGYKLGEELGLKIKTEVKVLLIFREMESSADYIKAYQKGLREGSQGKLSSFEVKLLQVPSPTDPALAPVVIERLPLTAERLDDMVSEAGDINVVVSLVDLPHNYIETLTAARVKRGDLALAAVVTSVYTLGASIQEDMLQAVVLPKQSFAERTEPAEGEEEVKGLNFDNRYLMITPRSLLRTLKANRKIFRLAVPDS